MKYRHCYTFYSYPGFELIYEAKVYNNGLIFQKRTLIQELILNRTKIVVKK